eukprot:GHVL01041898.1.p2 GENE.GHVL01041898.1~~GHVL01041898.1.p2  ORF type:complete len:254 (+),score=66.10 GHVL01041898.1:58-819(+)
MSELDFVEAVRKKYQTKITEDDIKEMFFVDSKTRRSKQIEFRGAEKTEKLYENILDLEKISINHCKMSHSIGGQIFSNLKVLLIEHCLLKYWKDFFIILSITPYINFLSISGNKMEKISNFQYINNLPIPPPLNYLVLSETNIPYKDVLIILKYFKNVKELRLRKNEYVYLEKNLEKNEKEEEEILEKLTLLDLDENLIKNWANLEPLKRLKNLEVLYIENNLLGETDDGNCHLSGCKKLRSLNISRNNITSW